METANQKQGHQGAITAISFSSDGKYLVSFSHEAAEVKFWNTAGSFFGILGSSRCIRTVPVKKTSSRTCPVQRPGRIDADVNGLGLGLSFTGLLDSVRFEWTSSRQVTLHYGDEKPITLSVH